MPAKIEAYLEGEQSPVLKYIFPGEMAAINLGKGLVAESVLLIGCDREDSCVDVYETVVPEGRSVETEDIESLYLLCTRDNRISELRGDNIGLSYGGLNYENLVLDVEHFYSMTIN